MTNWTLHGSGRNDHDQWPQLHELTHDWTAAWADNEGFHLEAMPAEAPNATHLWAWTTGRWLRVRLDVPHWWAAVLATPTAGGPRWEPAEVGIPRISQVLHWAAEDQRIKQFRGNRDVFGTTTIQLLPQKSAISPFIGARDSLPEEYTHLLD